MILRMGLESVELVMAWEEEFGIEISDGEAEKTLTVGQAVDLIHDKLRESVDLPAEDLVREKLAEITGQAPDRVTPTTTLAELFPKKRRRKTWAPLRREIGWSVIPDLERPRWLVISGWGVTTGTTLLFWPRWLDMLVLFPLIGIAWLALTLPLRTAIPPAVATVGSLMDRLRERRERLRSHQSLDHEAVREKVVAIIVEQIGVKAEQCTDEARFVADLGVG